MLPSVRPGFFCTSVRAGAGLIFKTARGKLHTHSRKTTKPDPMPRRAKALGPVLPLAAATFGAVVIMVVVTTPVTTPVLKWSLARGPRKAEAADGR